MPGDALHRTDLDLQLRRPGIITLVGGVSTNVGVESTVRQAHEHGSAQIVVSDATAAFTLEDHENPIKRIFPTVARLRTTDEVLAALTRSVAIASRP